jgi:hypothetical protein
MSDQPPPPGGMPPPPPPPFPSTPQGPRPSVGVAISWAFDRFKTNAGGFIALAAVVAVIQLLSQFGTRLLDNNTVNRQFAIIFLVSLLFAVAGFLAQIGVQRAAIRSTQGVKPSFDEMFTAQFLGTYILFQLAYFALILVGAVLCILPGLVVWFLFQLGPYYILDKGYGVVEAMKASYSAVTKNFVPALLMTLFSVIVLALGVSCCGLFTLVTLPFTCLFTAHMYRQFNNESIA